MGAMASQITSLTIVYSTVRSGPDQRKHQGPASLAFVWGIHRRPVNSPHKWPVTRKIFPFDDVIMTERDVPNQDSSRSNGHWAAYPISKLWYIFTWHVIHIISPESQMDIPSCLQSMNCHTVQAGTRTQTRRNEHSTWHSSVHSLPRTHQRCRVNNGDVMTWKHWPHYWPFVKGINRWPVNFSWKRSGYGGVVIFFIILVLDWWYYTPWLSCEVTTMNNMNTVVVYCFCLIVDFGDFLESIYTILYTCFTCIAHFQTQNVPAQLFIIKMNILWKPAQRVVI